MNKLKYLSQIIQQNKGKKLKALSLIQAYKKKIKETNEELIISKQAQAIIQVVAQQTQKQLEWHISEIVSLALSSVFDNPYDFKIEFVVKRGKTECNFFFERNGKRINPIESASGGAVDVTSFALRIALWSLSKNTMRNILIFDEPFKNINDKTRETHKRIAKMIKMLSKKLKIQFIIITMIPELINSAKKNYEFKIENGKTKIIKEYI